MVNDCDTFAKFLAVQRTKKGNYSQHNNFFMLEWPKVEQKDTKEDGKKFK